MMTTMLALMATLPIAIGSGARGKPRRPLGAPAVGGLAVSSLVTLYVTPAVHTSLDTWQGKIHAQSRRGPGQTPTDAPDPEPSSQAT
jgi:Cu/Ag efflux pump CusA